MLHSKDLNGFSGGTAGNGIQIKSNTALSGYVDMLNAQNAVVLFYKANSAVKVRYQARHASASTTLYASATSFDTPVDLSGVVTSGITGYTINWANKKRYLRLRMSGSAASVMGAVVLSHRNDLHPPTYSATAGIRSMTYVE